MNKMKWIGALAMLVAAGAQAQFTVNYGNTRSGVKDQTGLESTETRFDASLDWDSGDGDLFINQFNLVGGTNWDSNINFNFDYEYSFFNGTDFVTDTYELGTLIEEAQGWYFRNLVSRFGTISSDVDAGVYDFSIQVVGGDNASATDILQTLDMQIEVVNTITALVTTNNAGTTIGWGEEYLANVQFNNTGTRDLVTTTWYISNFGLGSTSNTNPGEQLEFLTFEGNWFQQQIAAGEVRSDNHSKWRAPVGTVPGTYFGNIGIYGGLYDGDWHSWRSNPDVSINVVPEPASMTALALGTLAMLRRRRKS